MKHRVLTGFVSTPPRSAAKNLKRLVPFPVTPIPWIPNGYFYPEDVRPSYCPFYQAGLYYLQEPSAMTPASCLPVTPGENVLDLCAAPGGKATELGARAERRADCWSQMTSVLPVPVPFFETWSFLAITNAFVANETPARLGEPLSGIFPQDPSGCTMFRRRNVP